MNALFKKLVPSRKFIDNDSWEIGAKESPKGQATREYAFSFFLLHLYIKDSMNFLKVKRIEIAHWISKIEWPNTVSENGSQ